MTSSIRHRGPDSAGFHRQAELHLGIRRLSIIDLEHGDQPIYNENRDKAVIFNGEIYNYKELRRQLEEEGHVFSTDADTEVIIHLFEEYGSRCVEFLQGMFAFAISDGKRLFLARDRLGMKPLYYARLADKSGVVFASEIKALFRSGMVDVSLSESGFSDYAVWGAPAGNRTLFDNVFCVRPGHFLVVEDRAGELSLREQEYYRVEIDPSDEIDFEAASGELAELLRSTVESHLLADVEVGISCSGGLDSGILAIMMDELREDQIHAFSIGDRDDHPDLVHARSLCRRLKCRQEIVIPEFEDYLNAIPGCIFAIERPTRLYGLPQYMLSHFMGQRVKVALCGEGADEIFGGYKEFRDRQTFRWSAQKIKLLERHGLRLTDEAAELAELASAGEDEEDSYLRRAFSFNMKRLAVHHLEPADKYAMSASLELRVPYMDHKVIEFVHKLPLSCRVDMKKNRQKIILKHMATEKVGRGIGPLARRRKMGFPQSILGDVARIRQMCDELLPKNYKEKHERGNMFFGNLELLIFDLFHDMFVRRKGSLDRGFDFVEFVKSR